MLVLLGVQTGAQLPMLQHRDTHGVSTVLSMAVWQLQVQQRCPGLRAVTSYGAETAAAEAAAGAASWPVAVGVCSDVSRVLVLRHWSKPGVVCGALGMVGRLCVCAEWCLGHVGLSCACAGALPGVFVTVHGVCLRYEGRNNFQTC